MTILLRGKGLHVHGPDHNNTVSLTQAFKYLYYVTTLTACICNEVIDTLCTHLLEFFHEEV